MRQFSDSSLHDMQYDGKTVYWFECAMCSSCPGAFDHLDDNYEVERVLREAGVILPQNETDSETCALVVNFSTKAAGLAFLERFNSYLRKIAA